MPFSGPGDSSLPGNVKKLGAKQRRRWVAVFNSAFAKCTRDGGGNCDGTAMKMANGVLKNASTTFAGLLGGKNALGRSVIEMEAAEPPETINLFPTPGVYKHPLWGDMEITEEGNQLFVDNFNAHVYQDEIPINAEHEKLSGAVGYIKELVLNDDRSIEARVNWTERGETLIRDDAYKFISPEWFEEWTDPASHEDFVNIVTGAAITTHPFFKNLRSLVASEGRLYDAGEDEDEERVPVAVEGLSMPDGSLLIRDSDDLKGALHDHGQAKKKDKKKEEDAKKHIMKRAKALNEEDLLPEDWDTDKEEHVAEIIKIEDLDIEEMDEKDRTSLFQRIAAFTKATISFGSEGDDGGGGDGDGDGDGDGEGDGDKGTKTDPKTAAEITSLQTKLTASEKAREASDKRLTGLESESLERRMRDIVLGRDEPSVLKAKEAEASPLRPMVGDGAQKLTVMRALVAAKGEDSEELKAYVASEREHANQLHEAGTFSELGIDSSGEPVSASTDDEFEKRIKVLTEGETKMPRDEAIAKIATEDPKLYNAYDKAHTGRKASFPGS